MTHSTTSCLPRRCRGAKAATVAVGATVAPARRPKAGSFRAMPALQRSLTRGSGSRGSAPCPTPRLRGHRLCSERPCRNGRRRRTVKEGRHDNSGVLWSHPAASHRRSAQRAAIRALPPMATGSSPPARRRRRCSGPWQSAGAQRVRSNRRLRLARNRIGPAPCPMAQSSTSLRTSWGGRRRRQHAAEGRQQRCSGCSWSSPAAPVHRRHGEWPGAAPRLPAPPWAGPRVSGRGCLRGQRRHRTACPTSGAWRQQRRTEAVPRARARAGRRRRRAWTPSLPSAPGCRALGRMAGHSAR
mmetsp:Transcript_20630/g.56941  ORF Transcript_20630/g.56941 Transcript_20630/m.56941 type:complete len:298 (-) Transcript_20630:601-1494(-)